jgi:aryl-alcohol dehydrogenase-like predicted oxidoreductase
MGGFIQSYLDDRTLTRVQRLKPIAQELDLTTSQLALAWVLRRPEVSSAIVGASRPEQVSENAKASGVQLDQGTLRLVNDALGDALGA